MQGTTRSGPVSLQLGFASDGFSYLIDLGIPIRDGTSSFNLDPEIKRELVWSGEVMRPASLLVRRRRRLVELREGRQWTPITDRLQTVRVGAHRGRRSGPRARSCWRCGSRCARGVSMIISGPTPTLRPARRRWAPEPRCSATTAVILPPPCRRSSRSATTRPSPRRSSDAFPQSSVRVRTDAGRFELELSAHGLLRPLVAAELSDGTLRYLLLVAALLSPRPPQLMVLNEPETSLHPDLLAPLARLIGEAGATTQIVVVSHCDEVDQGTPTVAADARGRVDQGLRRDPDGGCRPARRSDVGLGRPLADGLSPAAAGRSPRTRARGNARPPLRRTPAG